MIASVKSVWSRLLGVLGRLSMYRMTVAALGALAVIAFGLSFAQLVVPGPAELAATAVVLVATCLVVNLAIQTLLRLPRRAESAVITAAILLFVLRPTLDPLGLAWIALGGAVAMASKYLIAWRGRHILNPAAVGASVLTIAGLSPSAWWVGSPVLAIPVVVLGLIVLIRIEKVQVVAAFLVIAVTTAFVRQAVQAQQAGFAFDPGTALSFALWSTPFLFLGAFMLSEPLTLPPRRWQQLTVAAVVGVLAGWPIPVGDSFTLGQERALLIGNLVAFVWAVHRTVRLRLVRSEMVTPTVRELTFETARPVPFRAGQYLELEVPHRRPDARGTRREFSIVSAPHDAPRLSIAYRVRPGAAESSYKRALATAEPGTVLAATGVWGDFLLPTAKSTPVLLVAAGIGITPFVSQLREASQRGDGRDAVLVYVASSSHELAFRDELAATGVRVIVVTRDEPASLPHGWRWHGERLDAGALRAAVPDLGERHAYISGSPALIADLSPALRGARSLTTDAFSGY